MEEQTLGIALLQELACGSSHQWGCGENPLQFVLPFSSFSCPGSWHCCHGRLGDGLPAPIEMQSIGNARGETLAWSGKWETAAGSRVTPCSGTSQDWASTGRSVARLHHGVPALLHTQLWALATSAAPSDPEQAQIIPVCFSRKRVSLVSCIKVVNNLWSFLINDHPGRSLSDVFAGQVWSQLTIPAGSFPSWSPVFH